MAFDVHSMSLEDLANVATEGGIEALEQLANTGEVAKAAEPGTDETPTEAEPAAAETDVEGETPEPAAVTPPPPEKEHSAAVANKSGTGTIPYAVLKGAREKAAQVETENTTLRKQLDELTRRVDSAAPAEQAAKAEVATDEVDTKIAAMQAKAEQLKDDFPELAELLVGQIDMLQATRKQLVEVQGQYQAERAQREQDDQAAVAETLQEAIDGNPVLTLWQGKAGAEWDASIAVDGLLRTQPEWEGKSFADRFAKVVEMVRVMHPEFEVPATEAKPASTEKELPAPPSKKRPPVNSLSDIPGGVPPTASLKEQAEELSGAALGNRFNEMTTDQINAYLASLAQ